MSTIAAISTGNIVSAIGVLRLSGTQAFAIADRVFRPVGGKKLSDCSRRSMILGTLRGRDGAVLDRCLAVTFAAGSSYTGEDCVEFHCHGSPVILNEGLLALFAAGAVQAGRGEFTRRAFLHGNLDLTQAEAVIDLIEAESVQAAHNAVEQLGGTLKRKIESVYDALLNISSQFYAVVDYPDEEIEDLNRDEIEAVLVDTEHTLQTLLATFRRGEVMRQGVPTAIVGCPNVGKSSLLNALLGYDRAIVTDVAGTTRDTIEEKAVVGGVLLRLIDTAGIRDTEDTVERIGVERSRSALETAQLVFAVVDSSRELTGEDLAVLDAAAACEKWILIRSKADLCDEPRVVTFSKSPSAQVAVSALTGEGLEELEHAVAELFPTGETPAGLTLTNVRQAEAVERAVRAVHGALDALCSGLTPDAALTDVEGALNALGELTGRTLREDLVGRIFERFCVGK